MPSRSERQEPRTIQSLTQTLNILTFIYEQGGAGVTEIADHIGLNKGTVHTHLNTLLEERFLVKDDTTYKIGLRFLGFGSRRSNLSKLYTRGKPEVDDLVEETGETVQIGVEEQGKGIYIYQSRGVKAVKTDSHIGTERYLHSTSFGKAILAHLPQERVDEIIERHGLPQVTDKTITNREDLMARLERVREQGAAFDDCEQIDGIRCVAVPVFGQEDEVLGAFSMTGPTKRMTESRFREEIPELLKRTTRLVELNIANS